MWISLSSEHVFSGFQLFGFSDFTSFLYKHRPLILMASKEYRQAVEEDEEFQAWLEANEMELLDKNDKTEEN